MELHCPVHVVKVGEKNNTAAAASSYIARNIVVGHDGRIHDYSKKLGFVAGGFCWPEGSPERWKDDPRSLWAEQDFIDYEKSTRRGPKSELYRSGRIGLPWDIPYEKAAELAEEFFEPLRKKGMVIQWAIHDEVDPVTKKRNYHMHWIACMREVTPDGFGKKNRSWNKYNGGMNIPEEIRPHVAGILNRELEALGVELRVEHESFEARGIDRIPQIHMGPTATALEEDRVNTAGEITREGIDSRNGERKRYIEFLNQMHAENLSAAIVEAKAQGLDSAILGAARQRDVNDASKYGIYRDWDALFAMLKDARRSKAAFRTEIKKLDKIAGAYARMNEAATDEEREKERSYITWAGCDPDDDTWLEQIRMMQHEARIGIRQMEEMEKMLLTSKELYKAHNKVVYTARKVYWDEYRIERDKRGIEYCDRRLESIRGYKDYLMSQITLMDVILQTDEWKEYLATSAELSKAEDELLEKKAQYMVDKIWAKKDLRKDKKAAREAVKNEKATRKQHR